MRIANYAAARDYSTNLTKLDSFLELPPHTPSREGVVATLAFYRGEVEQRRSATGI